MRWSRIRRGPSSTGSGTGRPGHRVHTGDCWGTRSRCRPAATEVARRALSAGIPACPHCRPDAGSASSTDHRGLPL
ncbi:DUF6233 domain-containing protein [Streptomyces sp. NPDC054865]